MSADNLGQLNDRIQRVLDEGVEYDEFYIDKATGGRRKIEEPVPKLKRVQESILRKILYRIKPHECAYGFIKGRGNDKKGIPECAAKHVGSEIVIRTDIKDFFHAVDKTMIKEKFEKYFHKTTFGPIDLDDLIEVLTYEDRLTMGAPSSPAVTNIVCKQLDARLQSMAQYFMEESGTVTYESTEVYRERYTYTRYADDLVVSTSDKETGTNIIPVIREKVEDCGFKLNEEKTRIMRRGNPQIVLGLTTNDKVNLPAKKRREFRARLHNLKMRLKDWHDGDADKVIDPETGRELDGAILEEIRGYVAHALNVAPKYGKRWRKEVREIEELFRKKQENKQVA